jgi:uncharacterized transporter YbjL
MGDLDKGVRIAIAFFGGVVTLIIMGFITLIISGSLTNTGALATGTQAYNGTQDLLNNVSVAVPSFFSNALTWFSLLSIVIIIATVVIVVRMVRSKDVSGR